MADSDVAIVTVNGRSVRIPKATFQFILISAQAELNSHRHEWDKEVYAPSAAQWTDQMLEHMFRE